MTLTPQKARDLLADLEKPDHLRDPRNYSYATPSGYHVGFGGQWRYYEAAQHLPDLLRFYADNADEPEPCTLSDLPVDEWPGTRVMDPNGDEGEALGNLDDNETDCCIRVERYRHSVYTWPADQLTLVEPNHIEAPRSVYAEYRGTPEERLRTEDKIRARYGLPPRAAAEETEDPEPAEDITEETPVRFPLNEEPTVKRGVEDHITPLTLADLEVDKWPGCYIRGHYGMRTQIIGASKLRGDYWIDVKRGFISYCMVRDEDELARIQVIGREGETNA
ncbi:hypothetical protein OS125_11410 [Corynebacterium sp. P7003]|uniref:Uncharacterized protein n=1 Tax=Corynebacterium pygosceleis TaxID=2800406 RepID=A0ABT3WX02_9CORY|nr:hypothetical protein [Corynebacterium pygosceleis]MCX7445839.1 hypothetical protein [Corynebacterium pygosceleis]